MILHSLLREMQYLGSSPLILNLDLVLVLDMKILLGSTSVLNLFILLDTHIIIYTHTMTLLLLLDLTSSLLVLMASLGLISVLTMFLLMFSFKTRYTLLLLVLWEIFGPPKTQGFLGIFLILIYPLPVNLILFILAHISTMLSCLIVIHCY